MKPFLQMVLFLLTFSWAAEVVPLRMKHARELASKGQLDESLLEYRAVLLEDPSNSQAYYEAGKVRALQKNWGAATRNFELALQKSPTHWDAMEALAQAREALGEKEKAMAAWRKLADNGNPEQKARAESRISKLLGHAVPTTELKEVEATNSPKAQNKEESNDFKAAMDLYDRGKWAESLAKWRVVLAKEPKNAGAFYYAGICRYNLGELDKAIYNLNKAFTYPEKGFNAHYYLGRIYEKQGNKKEAIQHYREYIAKTDNAKGKADVEKRIKALGPIETTTVSTAAKTKEGPAEKVAEKTTLDSTSKQQTSPPSQPAVPDPARIVPLESIGLYAIAETEGVGRDQLESALRALNNKDFNRAIDSLKVMRLNYPGTKNAMAAGYNLVILYQLLGLSEKVKNLSVSLLRESPKEPYLSAIRYALAKALLELGDVPQARSVLDSVKVGLPLGPEAVKRSELTSKILEQMSAEKEVPAVLNQAISEESDPARKAQLLQRLAKLYVRQNALDSARKAYQNVAALCSSDLGDACRSSAYGSADLEYRNKQWDKAMTLYRAAVQKYAQPEDAPWGYYQIGNILRNQKKLSDALKVFDDVIQKFPGSYWAEQAKWNKDDIIWRGQNANLLNGN